MPAPEDVVIALVPGGGHLPESHQGVAVHPFRDLDRHVRLAAGVVGIEARALRHLEQLAVRHPVAVTENIVPDDFRPPPRMLGQAVFLLAAAAIIAHRDVPGSVRLPVPEHGRPADGEGILSLQPSALRRVEHIGVGVRQDDGLQVVDPSVGVAALAGEEKLVAVFPVGRQVEVVGQVRAQVIRIDDRGAVLRIGRVRAAVAGDDAEARRARIGIAALPGLVLAGVVRPDEGTDSPQVGGKEERERLRLAVRIIRDGVVRARRVVEAEGRNGGIFILPGVARQVVVFAVDVPHLDRVEHKLVRLGRVVADLDDHLGAVAPQGDGAHGRRRHRRLQLLGAAHPQVAVAVRRQIPEAVAARAVDGVQQIVVHPLQEIAVGRPVHDGQLALDIGDDHEGVLAGRRGQHRFGGRPVGGEILIDQAGAGGRAVLPLELQDGDGFDGLRRVVGRVVRLPVGLGGWHPGLDGRDVQREVHGHESAVLRPGRSQLRRAAGGQRQDGQNI